MSEEVKQGLKLLIDTLQEGKGFILEQAPDICRELAYRGVMINSFAICICLGFMIFYAVYAFLVVKDSRLGGISLDDYLEEDFLRCFVFIFGGIVSIVCSVIFLISAVGLMQWILFPKSRLLEELIRLTKDF